MLKKRKMICRKELLKNNEELAIVRNLKRNKVNLDRKITECKFLRGSLQEMLDNILKVLKKVTEVRVKVLKKSIFQIKMKMILFNHPLEEIMVVRIAKTIIIYFRNKKLQTTKRIQKEL